MPLELGEYGEVLDRAVAAEVPDPAEAGGVDGDRILIGWVVRLAHQSGPEPLSAGLSICSLPRVAAQLVEKWAAVGCAIRNTS
ncbi:MAG TPA: hypothetical protein VJ986_04915, partial [Gaiellaceae bacterium]|nr:hypothetical protein [Gaiellaceae bacterium]